jgi:4'-phosphopantetheinyl transferase
MAGAQIHWRWLGNLDEAGWPGAQEVLILEWELPSDLTIESLPWSDLTAEERQRAQRYVAAEARQQFVLCRSLLRRWLGKCLGLPASAVVLTSNEQGKPMLARTPGVAGQLSEPLHFNVSHTRGQGVVVVARLPVGVDVERVRPLADLKGLVHRYFTAAEQAAWCRYPPDERLQAFFRLWTGKEAVLKAAGLSLASLQEFVLHVQGSEQASVQAVQRAELQGEWQVHLWQRRGSWQFAVAVQQTAECPRGDRACG